MKWLGLLAAVLMFTGCSGKQKLTQEDMFVKAKQNSVKLVSYTGGSGTGSYVQYKDKTYILTAAHVCSLNDLYIQHPRSAESVKILKSDNASDTCIIQSTRQGIGLELADSSLFGDYVLAVGYPNRKDHNHGEWPNSFYVFHGQLRKFDVFDVYTRTYPPCRDGYQELTFQPFMGVKRTICVLRRVFRTSTLNTLPGTSGSSIIDQHGEVIGLVSASGGLLIPLEDIRNVFESIQTQ